MFKQFTQCSILRLNVYDIIYNLKDTFLYERPVQKLRSKRGKVYTNTAKKRHLAGFLHLSSSRKNCLRISQFVIKKTAITYILQIRNNYKQFR